GDALQRCDMVLLDPIADELAGDRELHLAVVGPGDAQRAEPGLELLALDLREQVQQHVALQVRAWAHAWVRRESIHHGKDVSVPLAGRALWQRRASTAEDEAAFRSDASPSGVRHVAPESPRAAFLYRCHRALPRLLAQLCARFARCRESTSRSRANNNDLKNWRAAQIFFCRRPITPARRRPASAPVASPSSRPKLSRMQAPAVASSRPIAARIRGGSGEPDEHAEPCETAIP